MQKMFAVFVVLLIMVNNVFSESEIKMNVRLSTYGVPGIQIENKINHFGLAIGVGIPYSVFILKNSDQETLSYFPFDIGINYYLLNTEDDIILFSNIGSRSIFSTDENNDLHDIYSSPVFSSGLGISTKLWKKINVAFKVGGAYLFDAYRKNKELEDGYPKNEWGLMVDFAVGFSLP